MALVVAALPGASSSPSPGAPARSARAGSLAAAISSAAAGLIHFGGAAIVNSPQSRYWITEPLLASESALASSSSSPSIRSPTHCQPTTDAGTSTRSGSAWLDARRLFLFVSYVLISSHPCE